MQVFLHDISAMENISAIENSDSRLKQYMNFLTPEEQAYYLSSVLLPKRKKQFLAGRVLLRTQLADILEMEPQKIELTATKNGKLFLEGNPLYFNISHSVDMVAVVIADINVGLDVELMRKRNFAAIANSYFNEEECADILSQPTPEQIQSKFYFYWTRKEAITKCMGERLFQNIQNYDGYSFYSCQEGEYSISVAYEAGDSKRNVFLNKVSSLLP